MPDVQPLNVPTAMRVLKMLVQCIVSPPDGGGTVIPPPPPPPPPTPDFAWSSSDTSVMVTPDDTDPSQAVIVLPASGPVSTMITCATPGGSLVWSLIVDNGTNSMSFGPVAG